MKKSSADVIVGAKFGRWTVLQTNVKNPESKAKKIPRQALCQCECGTLRYKTYSSLYTGASQSCGCARNEQLAIRNIERGTIINIGDQFGELTVIKDLGMRKQKSRNKNERWSLCKCSCGNEIEVRNNNLKTGTSKSCGCIKSRGEKIITNLLRTNNINFTTQYTFPDLKSENNGFLRFDFAIFKNNSLYSLIEFDGRQHFFGPDATWAKCDNLETIQIRDKLKDEYCKNHNIKLIRIPYYDIGKISLETLELNDY